MTIVENTTVKDIYTDGACSGNPGPGGWGTRIEFADGQVHELGGRDADTTNNRMEMQAAIAALEFLEEANIAETAESPVTLHTDSEYLKNGITKWIKGWKRKGWKTSSGKPVQNKDLWQQLDKLTQNLTADKLSIDWRYVRGHTGNPGNERCDEIARAYSHAQPISLRRYASDTRKTQKSGDKSTKSDPRDTSIDKPEINTATTQDSSQTPTLRFYESSPQETANDMATSKNNSSQEIVRIERIKNTLETLQVTDEIAKHGYLITSAELADLMDVNASAVTSRGDYWAWRNWTVSRIRREGNQILWQLERIDE
ncbi:MAG: ribonuclease HI [Cyanobacteria bacterium P01_F01_bin.3]